MDSITGVDDAIKFAEEKRVKFVDLEFTDVKGDLHVETYVADALKGILEEGVYFDGSSIPGMTEISDSDLLLVGDPSTIGISPFSPENLKSARIVCDIKTPGGDDYELAPRTALKKLLERAEREGIEFIIGYEPEFFLFNGKEPGDSADYFAGYSEDAGLDIRKEILLAANEAGIKMDKAHHEVAKGQHELGFLPGPVLHMSDRLVLYRELVKFIAKKHGLTASFDPKPFEKENGSGCHTHFSFRNGSEHPFYDADRKFRLSDKARYFIRGVIDEVPALTALLNPSESSSKRLVPGYEAPTRICIGERNRSALIRVPAFSSPGSARVEIRSPDPTLNPYVAYAGILGAGLKGIEKGKDISPEMVVETSVFNDGHNLWEIPSSLDDAMAEFRKSDVIRAALGPALHELYSK